MVTTPNPNMRLIYDELETARIAIYPIDARGLMVYPGLGLFAQHGLMQDVAEATGGLAFYNTNGLWQSATQVVQTDRDFYTLSYAPTQFQYDNKWHKVRVSVDVPDAHLSYRRGYFADSSHAETPKGPRTRLLAGNRKIVEDPDLRTAPIVFSAQVEPVSPAAPLKASELPVRQGQTRYRIAMSLPFAAFTRHMVEGESQIGIGVGLVAMNRQGTPLLKQAKKIKLTVNEEKLRLTPDTTVPIEQKIDLNRGDTYLQLAVWDATSGRFGMLNIPLHVPTAATQ